MALTPKNMTHAAQIQAGIKGRKRGHKFEFELAESINNLKRYPLQANPLKENVFKGDPAQVVAAFAAYYLGWPFCDKAEAVALGSLATAEEGKKWLEVNGIKVRACKSDVLLTLYKGSEEKSIGLSVKQCNTKNPTNAQLFFTTASAFCEMLRRNGICVSRTAENALRQFCGDTGYQPKDNPQVMEARRVSPDRFFWEEISKDGRKELEDIFIMHQDKITRLLLQRAYPQDPFIPELLLHKTKKIETGPQEFALYSIDGLIELSKRYRGFEKNKYIVRKGRHKDPPGVSHEAPRFGIIQMQRGGQKQHPTQLQFNLKAGYFYKI